tara:strand:+ start:2973 stop:3920 length:948 start_codon:yes stop_codon:yes gene_type:complete
MSSMPVIFLTGPTAVGKTELAISLTEKLEVDLINVDAVQVYRGLDIGTGKPRSEILDQYPHELVDIREPSDIFSAGEFCRESVRSIQKIHQEKKIPLLVGGTMFYFDALTNGLGRNVDADQRFRLKIQSEAELVGWDAMHKRLNDLAPEIAIKIHPNDRQRIQRGLEVCRDSRNSTSSFDNGSMLEIPIENQIIRLGLALADRSRLHARIQQRVDKMLEAGLVAEVQNLLAKGFDPELPSLRSLGYRQVCQYLKGEFDYDSMRTRMIVATRQFAKRQYTWMRNTPNTVWFNGDDKQVSRNVVRYLLLALTLKQKL